MEKNKWQDIIDIFGLNLEEKENKNLSKLLEECIINSDNKYSKFIIFLVLKMFSINKKIEIENKLKKIYRTEINKIDIDLIYDSEGISPDGFNAFIFVTAKMIVEKLNDTKLCHLEIISKEDKLLVYTVTNRRGL